MQPHPVLMDARRMYDGHRAEELGFIYRTL